MQRNIRRHQRHLCASTYDTVETVARMSLVHTTGKGKQEQKERVKGELESVCQESHQPWEHLPLGRLVWLWCAGIFNIILNNDREKLFNSRAIEYMQVMSRYDIRVKPRLNAHWLPRRTSTRTMQADQHATPPPTSLRLQLPHTSPVFDHMQVERLAQATLPQIDYPQNISHP